MAIPSGGGTEVLKSHRALAGSDSWVDLIPVADCDVNKIVTVLSIIAMNGSASTEYLSLGIFTYNGSAYANESRYVNTHSMVTKATFVWNDKFVLTATDSSNRQVLRALSESAGDFDYHTSYIVQDWT